MTPAIAPSSSYTSFRQIVEISGKVSTHDLERAQAAAAAAHKRLDEALLDLGILGETALQEIADFGLGVAKYDGLIPVPDQVRQLLPSSFVANKRALPVAVLERRLVVAMVQPFDDFAARAIELKTGFIVERQRATEEQFEAVYASLFGELPQHENLTASADRSEADVDDLEILRESASDAPVIRFVQDMVRAAVAARVSDIHLRAARGQAELLWRIDGELLTKPAPDLKLLPAIVSRLKILANLDISERRLPQDGRIRLSVAGEAIDLRMSTMPNIYGEGVVLRLLSRQVGEVGLKDLGFSPHIESHLESLFGFKDGLILVTGPTGSGKSTTLHAALRQLIRPGVNVVTIEDPVEYRLDGASQVQVDEKIGLTFPRVLRSLLRQDPDVILIGEIRDGETAKIAIQAALTGHLVLATLHTNSAAAAVPRLIDMGVETYLLAAVLRGSLAQRLVRRVCPECTAATTKTQCATCDGSGYSGRVAIGELLALDPELTTQLAHVPVTDLSVQDILRRNGFVPIGEDAANRLANGEIAAKDLETVMATNGH